LTAASVPGILAVDGAGKEIAMARGRFCNALMTLVAGLALLAGAAPCAAQTYPTRPIRLIVAFPPGGINDIAARLMGQKLSPILGQPIVIENRTGASGTIGADIAAKSPPDGYTLLLGSVSNIAMAPGQHPHLPYDPTKDFAPIALVAAAPNVLVVHPSFPVDTVEGLIAMAKKKPGELNYASAGEGSSNHLTGELFKSLAGVDIVHIPYKGDAPAIADVVAGHVPMIFAALPPALPFIQDGKLRAIAVSSEKRSSFLPEVPTVAQSGDLPTFAVSVWVGILAPAGTPAAIVERLNGAIAEALRQNDTLERLKLLGVEADYRGPDAFGAYLRAEIVKWTAVGRKTP
jgi:tripartite-type tricarboxylate transporter receptor subunit TctC